MKVDENSKGFLFTNPNNWKFSRSLCHSWKKSQKNLKQLMGEIFHPRRGAFGRCWEYTYFWGYWNKFGHNMLAHRQATSGGAHVWLPATVHLPTSGGGVVGPLSIWTLKIEVHGFRWTHPYNPWIWYCIFTYIFSIKIHELIYMNYGRCFQGFRHVWLNSPENKQRD